MKPLRPRQFPGHRPKGPGFSSRVGMFLANPKVWSPLDLGASLRPFIVPSVSRSMNLLFQDAAKTTPATAHDDPVRVATCPYTSEDWTASSDAARPLLKTDGTYWWLEFDGSDDGLVGPAAASLSGDSFISIRASENSAGPSRRIVQSNAVNGVMSLRRNDGFACFAATLIAAGPFVADTNAHSMTLQKASAGNWALFVDGGSQSVNAVTTDWGIPGAGFGGTSAEGFPGKLGGLGLAAANLSSTDRGFLEAFLASLLP